MANTPNPRSYFQILSDMIDTFVSRAEIERLKVGNPLLTIMEAAAQSDVRSTQDYFNLLNSISLDSASGIDLDKIANREGTARLPAKSSVGFVKFTDSTINKISSIVYQGSDAPVPNTVTLKIEDASLFPSSGKVYIGRGTANYEGPIPYTSKTNAGAYWTITLSGSGTTNFHNIGESVILAQNGVRTIAANTLVRVPQGTTDSIVFSTLNQVFIEDGETFVDNVEVIAQQAGKFDVPAKSIKEVLSQPFAGITVINDLPLTNGRNVESDSDLRERIRTLRQSRVNGTAGAIQSAILGASSDGKTIVSSKIYQSEDGATVFIDDGSGYEESFDGVAYEILTNSALGGEQIFELSQRPVAKAFLQSSLLAPFAISNGSILAVSVGGVVSEHVFGTDDFSNINSATAYEVVSSINGNKDLNFSAKTVNGGKQVIIFAKDSKNEDLQISSPSGENANNFFNFSLNKVYTLRLYKNDQLLFQDGSLATISSKPQNMWTGSIAAGDTLSIKVDGTSTQTITVTDQDFIDSGTGYLSVSSFNSLNSWATVLSNKIAGATVNVSQDTLVLTSNKGYSSKAAIQITGGTLLSKGMFDGTEYSVGTQNDYSLNKNLSQLKLKVPLLAGDKLTVSTENTRAFLESSVFGTGSITFGSNAELYLIVDGSPEIVQTSLNPSISISITNPATNVARYTSVSSIFDNLRKGDYFFTLQAGTDNGFWKISDATSTSFDVERSIITPSTLNFSNFTFLRTNANIQKLTIPSGTYSLTALASFIQSNLENVNCYVYKNTRLRISVNKYSNSNILLVGGNASGLSLGLPVLTLKQNSQPQNGFSESRLNRVRTPRFAESPYTSVGAGSFGVSPQQPPIVATDSLYYTQRAGSWGAQQGNIEEMSDLTSASSISYRANPFLNDKIVNDRFTTISSVAISPRDSLSVVVDKDIDNKAFNVQMFRNLTLAPAQSYSNATSSPGIEFVDQTGGSLYTSFGSTTTLFEDFAVYMRARGKSHSTTANTSILFRNSRFGPEGEGARVAYANPLSENATMSFSSKLKKDFTVYNIHLPGGALKTPTLLTNNHRFVSAQDRSYGATAGNVVRAGTTVTVTLSPVANVTCHTLEVGDHVYQFTDENSGNIFRAGPKKITTVTPNSFSYTEAGSTGSSAISISYATPEHPAGTRYTITALSWSPGFVTATIGSHNFKYGDIVYFSPGHLHLPTGQAISYGSFKIQAFSSTTITWVQNSVTTSGTASLVSGVDYTVSEGRAVRKKVVEAWFPVEIGNLSRTSNEVTATLTISPLRQLASQHDYAVGDFIYIDTTDVNFPSGYKTVSAVFGTNIIKYIEAGVNATSTVTARIGYGPAMNLSPIVVGDVLKIDKSSKIIGALAENKVARVASVSSGSFSFYEDFGDSTISIPVFKPVSLESVNYLKFYPISAPNANTVISWVNSNASAYLSAVSVPSNGSGSTTGLGTISTATVEEFFISTNNASFNGSGNRSVEAFPLFDGVNAVRSCLIDNSNSKLRFKKTVSGELTTNADFSNETFKISPVTPKKISQWLNSSGVSSLFNNATASVSGNSGNVTIATNSLGSGGAIEITGGSANSVVAIASSGAQNISIPLNDDNGFDRAELGFSIEAPLDQLNGFVGNQWVSAKNAVKTYKSLSTGSISSVTITNTSNLDSLLTFSFLPLERKSYVSLSGKTLQFETYGNFTQVKDVSGGALAAKNVFPGSFVYISSSAAALGNTGLKKVVATNTFNNIFWVEGAGVTEKVVCSTNDALNFIGYNSWCPGDTIIVSNDLLGPDNNGSFVISDYQFDATNQITGIKVSAMKAGSYTGVEVQNIKVVEKDLLNIYAYVAGISPISSTTGRLLLKFNQTLNYYVNNLGSVAAKPASDRIAVGAIITGLDKLDFNTNVNEGLDGYKYNTGLLAEANRIIHGDESNSFIYPGVAATGTLVGLSGPLVKRIKLSLGIRTDTSNISDTIARVKNAVATVINNSLAGASIAFSDILEAANRVEGVSSVVPLYPEYNNVNDLINIQGYEKARILDINNDITVTLLG